MIDDKCVIKALRVTKVWGDHDHPPTPILAPPWFIFPAKSLRLCSHSFLHSVTFSHIPGLETVSDTFYMPSQSSWPCLLPCYSYNNQFHTTWTNSREVQRKLVPPHGKTVGNCQHCTKANWKYGRGKDLWDDHRPEGWQLVDKCILLFSPTWTTGSHIL